MGINIPIHLQHVVIQYQPIFKAVPMTFIITQVLNYQIIVFLCINRKLDQKYLLTLRTMIKSTVHKP